MNYYVNRACTICDRPFVALKSRLDIRPTVYCSRGCMQSREAGVRRFWSKVEKGSGCWYWTGAILGYGYGHLHFGGVHWLAHRLAYTLEVGPIPANLQVLHACDHPNCVKPAHLFLGTVGDNIKDGVRKGRIIPPRRLASRKSQR